jgi:ribosomal protein S18 acetylase RimI-like enzyme
MKNPNVTFVVRRCGVRDVSRLRDLLKVCWHTTYDRMIGQQQSVRMGRHVYSKFNLGYFIAQSLLSRASTMLLATRDGSPVGFATAQFDGAEVVLYGLYVHPDWQGKGIGSALLDAVIAGHPDAKAIRLEVLKDNAAAIAWYQAKGFESYGGTENATGMADVPSLYMDKRLGAHTRSGLQQA